MNSFPENWKLVPLEKCMEAIIDYRGKTPKKSDVGIPLLSAKVIKNGRILEEIFEFLPAENYDAWMRRGLPKAGDIVMTTEGPLGEIAQLDSRKYALGQRIVTLRGKQDLLDNNYLKFMMQSSFIQDQLNARATGTTVLGIKQQELRKITLALPPLPEQRAIAHILGSLDDKIELNRRMNATLEATARALFQSWFVNFDPVHAKARGEQPFGMDAATADLFPSRFVDSELGPIPEGWRVSTIGEQVELAYGKALKAENRADGHIPVYGSNGQVGWHNEKLVSGPGIIVGRKGNPGTVVWSQTDFFSIDTTFYVIPKTDVPLSYLFYMLQTQDLPSLSADSAVPGLNRNLAYMSQILIPSHELLIIFDALISSLINQIDCNEKESRTLAETRDALLPKLLSGEVRVGDVEKAIEEAS